MNSLVQSLRKYFPEEAMGEKICQLRDITHKSNSLADEIFHAQDAENWGNGFIISDELVKNAKNLLEVSMRDLTTSEIDRLQLTTSMPQC
jgi:hypothetical protein